jgi:hypothetical protein
MSRQRALPVELIKADPSPGRWHATGSRVYAYGDDGKDVLIADCELPGSDMDRHGPSNIDAVEQTRAVAKVNAKLMAQAKAMADVLNLCEQALRAAGVEHEPAAKAARAALRAAGRLP